jgi:hypothetical protein
MKKTIVTLSTLFSVIIAQAALKPGDSLSPYEIKNVSSGKEYCQVCAYGAKPGKLVAFGKLADEAFWADLKKLQKLQDDYKDLGVFAQVIDSNDTVAIKAAAAKHGVKFVVIMVVQERGQGDKVEGVTGLSTTNRITRSWTLWPAGHRADQLQKK